ncbi:MAG: hypothetical protein ACK2T7_04635 [Anaerolineales bacterium]
MNKSKLIWGIICLAIAVLLAVLNLTLEPEKLIFTIGEQNMPWVPVGVLGAIGILLLATMGGGADRKARASAGEQPATAVDPEKAALNKRLETIAWGLFLIMLGGFLFVPEQIISGGIWPIGVGLIMLGLNLARYFSGLKMSGFTTALGIISVVGGVLELIGWAKLEGGVLLVILGAYLLLKPWFDRRQIFGKAETS